MTDLYYCYKSRPDRNKEALPDYNNSINTGILIANADKFRRKQSLMKQEYCQRGFLSRPYWKMTGAPFFLYFYASNQQSLIIYER